MTYLNFIIQEGRKKISSRKKTIKIKTQWNKIKLHQVYPLRVHLHPSPSRIFPIPQPPNTRNGVPHDWFDFARVEMKSASFHIARLSYFRFYVPFHCGAAHYLRGRSCLTTRRRLSFGKTKEGNVITARWGKGEGKNIQCKNSTLLDIFFFCQRKFL